MSPYIKKILLNFLSFFLIAFSLYIFISLLSYDPADPGTNFKTNSENISNLGGQLGAKIADFLLMYLGFGSYLALLIGFVGSLERIFLENVKPSGLKLAVRSITSFFLIVAFCAVGEYFFNNLNTNFKFGGAVGYSVFSFMSNYIGDIGALIFLLILIIPMASESFNFSWKTSLIKCQEILIIIFTFLKAQISKAINRIQSIIKALQNNYKTSKKNKKLKTPKISSEPQIKDKSLEPPKSDLKQADLPIPSDVSIQEVSIKETDEPLKKIKESPVMPSTELLDKALDDGSSLSESELNQIAELLEIKLDEFGIQATVESVLPGPVVTRFEVQPAPGTKASRITNIAQDIARSLSVSSVRVVEVIEGKSFVGIEIPNTNRKMVRLTEILSSKAFKSSASNLSLALGQDISGNPIVVDLTKMPHLLIAGTTGSGKSVGLNAMLLSLLFKSDPEDVRLILVDPKMLELAVYDGIPHLLTPVITDMTDASNGLRWCVAEMDRRYKLMSMMGVRNLVGFNKKILDAEKDGKQILNPLVENEEEYLETLPSIVVVVDEFADMMMLVGKKVEHLIARIAQKARAAGIHLILATQRPSVDVITGLIKANIPTRIGFQVSTKIDSRTILDQGGAEQLLGYGDMLYLPPGVGVPVRVHGAFVGDDEVHRVVNDWKSRAKPNYVDDIISSNQDTGPIPGWSGADTSSVEDQDELYDEAVNFVIESRRASISAVQRKLRIGYNRAARLIETMEEAGLVSEMSSNGSREVLVPKRD